MKKVLVMVFRVFNGKRIELEGSGATLKECCLEWDSKRTCCDDLWDAFKSSNLYKNYINNDNVDVDLEDYDSIEEVYNDFIDSLSGQEMYDIMKDGQYHQIRYNFEGIIDIWLRKQNEYTLYQLYTDFLDYEEISYEYNQEFSFKDIIEDCDFIDFLSMKFEDSDFINDIINELGIDN